MKHNLQYIRYDAITSTINIQLYLMYYTFKNVLSPMEKIASIRAVYIASTRHVTGLTETVCVMSNLVSCDIY